MTERTFKISMFGEQILIILLKFSQITTLNYSSVLELHVIPIQNYMCDTVRYEKGINNI